jgi:hypothetical protein
LDSRTFVVAYHDETNDDFSFQIYDTNGTQILTETDVDTTSGGLMDYKSIGVSAFNDTTFVIGWHDNTDLDTTFAVYNRTGTLLSGPTDADTNADGLPVQVSCFNSTHFVIVWRGGASGDRKATFAVYTSSSVLVAGPTNADASIGVSSSISVSAFNSTVFVIAWFDVTDQDATFAVYDSAGTNLVAATDMDTSVGAASHSVSVSALNSTHFAAGWFDYDASTNSFAVYDSTGSLQAGPTIVDATSGYSYTSNVAALNSTAFTFTWYDAGTDRDLSFRVYASNGTALTAQTDIETWATAANLPFRYHFPCSQETATGIKIYNDNWIIAYANTTTQAIWTAYTPSGAAWDGTLPVVEPYTLPESPNRRAVDKGFVMFEDPYELTYSTLAAWETINCSSQLAGLNATGAVLQIHNFDSVTNRKCDVRAVGSTDDHYVNSTIASLGYIQAFVNLTDYSFQIESEVSDIHIFLSGYTDDLVRMWTIKPSITPTSALTWFDRDLSSYIPSNASGVIVKAMTTGASQKTCQIRKPGSTDDRGKNAICPYGAIYLLAGVNSTLYVQMNISNLGFVQCFLVGYICSPFFFYTNALNTTLSATLNTWEDNYFFDNLELTVGVFEWINRIATISKGLTRSSYSGGWQPAAVWLCRCLVQQLL